MFWKRKKKERDGKEAPVFLTKAAMRLNDRLLRWATHLQQRAKRCSPKKLKLLVGMFCLFLTLCSAAVFIESLKEGTLPFHVTPIQVMPLVKRSDQQTLITKNEYLRFRRLRRYLDSLANTPSGKPRLDSILQKHPNLLDTLTLLENIYHQQHKN